MNVSQRDMALEGFFCRCQRREGYQGPPVATCGSLARRSKGLNQNLSYHETLYFLPSFYIINTNTKRSYKELDMTIIQPGAFTFSCGPNRDELQLAVSQ